MKIQSIAALGVLLGLSICIANADTGTITVDVDKPGVKISPSLYGLMTEEINHSYDGGLYGELIQNRIFQDNRDQPAHWSLVKSDGADGSIAIDTTDPVNTVALMRSLRLDVATIAAGQRVGVANDGYWGIPVWPNTQYRCSFYAKAGAGFTGPLTVAIESNDGGTVFTSAQVLQIAPLWRKYQVVLSTGNVPASQTNRFVISTTGKGSIWLSLVSLFEPTVNNRPNGTRIDIMQLLGDLHPAFLRFPGGNYLEGDTVDTRFAWKKTLGPLEDRPGHQGPWSYRSSDGLGLLEFLNWCEDLHMEPILAVYAGYSLRHITVGSGPALDPFIQEALDEIQYVTGDASTTWGAQRAKDGHPAPFKLRYVEIGNEDWFDGTGGYDGRYARLYDAIKAKYPNLQLIATASVKSRPMDVLDEHFYRPARAMERDTHHYDTYDRKGPKIFVGEWATQEGTPTPDMNAAVADAAWLTGLERNSDLVVISCYAPLLVNVNRGGRQWGTNLIGYDALGSFGSPSYYAQKMFAENRGDTVLPVQIAPAPSSVASTPAPTGGVGVGTWQTSAEFANVKVTQADQVLYQTDFAQGDDDWRFRQGAWHVTGGHLQQTSNRQDCRATTGETGWGDYVYTLKARKISGSEGFLVLFHYADRNNFVWWNVGGWGNARAGLEQTIDGQKSALGDSTSVTIQTGRWYDIRIETSGLNIKCYLDGKLITEATEAPTAVPLVATASRDDSSGDVILKVVNPLATAQPMEIDLHGAGTVAGATITELSGSPRDVNSIAMPKKIYPKQVQIEDAGTKFVHEFPACSVTVIRLNAK